MSKIEELNVRKVELEMAKDVSEIRRNPIVETFVTYAKTFVPFIGDLIDTSVNCVLEEYQNKKRMDFCEYILDTPELITKEKVSDVDFLIEFGKTMDVINKLAQNEKLIYISGLFKNTFITKDKYDVSEYEEWLRRLDELSYREIELLVCLYNTEVDYYKADYDSQKTVIEYQKVVDVWFEFLKKAERLLDISQESIESIILSITRTGFVKQEDIDIRESTLKVYYVSDYFVRFIKRITGKE